jgi:hypothetical protein
MGTTTEAAWPAQLTLPGQTAAHPGPIDMRAMYVMHHGFRRDLAAFAAAAPCTPVSDRASWKALAGRWDVFSRVLHHHHSGEDAGLWPLLRERADAHELALLDAMEAEHAEIDPALADCAAGFARLAEHADETAREALAVRLVEAQRSLARHLEHEETEAIALMQRVMTPDDWRALEEEHFKKGVPAKMMLAIVPWAALGLSDDVRERAFGDSGRVVRVLWRLTHRRFERRERVAFRYL